MEYYDFFSEDRKLRTKVVSYRQKNKPLDLDIYYDAIDLECYDILNSSDDKEMIKKAFEEYYDEEIIECSPKLEYALLNFYLNIEDIERKILIKSSDKEFLYLFSANIKCLYGIFFNERIMHYYFPLCTNYDLIFRQYISRIKNIKKEVLELFKTKVNFVDYILFASNFQFLNEVENKNLALKISIENNRADLAEYILENFKVGITNFIDRRMKNFDYKTLKLFEKFDIKVECIYEIEDKKEEPEDYIVL